MRQQGVAKLGPNSKGTCVARKAGPFPTRAGVLRGVVKDAERRVLSAGAYVSYDLAGLRPNSVYRFTVKAPVDAASRRVNERPTASSRSGEVTRRDAASTVGCSGESTRRDAASTVGCNDAVGCEITNREEVFCFDGKEKSRTFQFPFSDKPGVYTVTLRDIATALETSVQVELKK